MCGSTNVGYACAAENFAKIALKSTILELQKSFKYKFSRIINFLKNETNTTLIYLQKKGGDIPLSLRAWVCSSWKKVIGTTYCMVDYPSLIIIISWIKDGYLWNLNQGHIFPCNIYLNFLYWYQWKVNNQTKTALMVGFLNIFWFERTYLWRGVLQNMI